MYVLVFAISNQDMIIIMSLHIESEFTYICRTKKDIINTGQNIKILAIVPKRTGNVQFTAMFRTKLTSRLCLCYVYYVHNYLLHTCIHKWFPLAHPNQPIYFLQLSRYWEQQVCLPNLKCSDCFGYVRPLRYFLNHFVLPINFMWCGLKLYFVKGGFILEDIFSV